MLTRINAALPRGKKMHAAAAVFHHYLLRDNTLRLMWPALRSAR